MSTSYDSVLDLLDEQLLVKVIKDKLMSKPCRNQGFVLDGFPETYTQAKELFESKALNLIDLMYVAFLVTNTKLICKT